MSISTNLYSSSTAEVLQRRMEACGYSDIKSAAFMLTGGREEQMIHQIGVELGVNEKPTDNNLSFDRYVSSSIDNQNLLFQGNDGNLYGLDFTTGKTSEQSEDAWIDKNYLGLIAYNKETGEYDYSDRNYDVIEFGQDSAEIINYSFTGAGDGVDEHPTDAYAAFGSDTDAAQWGNSVKWVYKEVDLEAPSQNFLNSVSRNRAKYISSTEANHIYNTQGFNAYVNKLVQNAVIAMKDNDSTGLSATELIEYYKKKLAEAEQQAEQEAQDAVANVAQNQNATETPQDGELDAVA